MEVQGVGNEIRIINQLQDVFKTLGQVGSVDLPQIVVVGAQSSGKSSVLESIVGWDFLPRGSGIVTRCPLYLQLMYVEKLPGGAVSHENDEESDEEEADHPKFVAKFAHKENVIFTDPQKIRREIEQRTNEIAGKGKNVVRDRIILKISSPDFIDLTLVDLPGLMKNPVGDQPMDIEQQTEDLIMSYISNENSIILAVTPMNADMVNSDSIKLARAVDPKFHRTLVVLTKLDIMDEGTNARKEMLGQVLPFKLGIVAITNRTQKDIEANKDVEISRWTIWAIVMPLYDAGISFIESLQSIKTHLNDEKAFFEKHYKELAKEQGIRYLSKKLNRVLMDHIRERMHSLRTQLEDAKASYRNDLHILGEKVEDKSVMVNQVLKKFSASYCDAITGSAPGLEGQPFGGGARINDIFHTDFAKALEALRPLGDLVLQDVKNAIEKCGGLHPTLFVPEDAFRQLIEERIASFREPAMDCVKAVHDELERVIEQSPEPVMRLLNRFPNLREDMYETVRRFLETRHDLAREFAEELVQAEMSYIDTKHPQFYSEASELVNAGRNSAQKQNNFNAHPGYLPAGSKGHQQQGQEKDLDVWSILLQNARKMEVDPASNYGLDTLADAERAECQLICQLVYKYFLIVRQTVQTVVPKGVIHRLVKFVQNNVEQELVKQLCDPEHFDELLRESQHTATLRSDALARLEEIDKGLVIIRNVRSHKVF